MPRVAAGWTSSQRCEKPEIVSGIRFSAAIATGSDVVGVGGFNARNTRFDGASLVLLFDQGECGISINDETFHKSGLEEAFNGSQLLSPGAE